MTLAASPARATLGFALLLALLPAPAAHAGFPLARRLLDARLARDLASLPDESPLDALQAGGEEVSLGMGGEGRGLRWSGDRFELVRARGPAGDQSLLAFDHRARRWWRLEAAGPGQLLAAWADPAGDFLLTRTGTTPARFLLYRLTAAGPERSTRCRLPWGPLDRALLQAVRQGGVEVTSPDTQAVAWTGLKAIPGGVVLVGKAFLGRRRAYEEAQRGADPTLGLTAREIMLSRDWIPPGIAPVELRIDAGGARPAVTGPFAERTWDTPVDGPGSWVLERPRP